MAHVLIEQVKDIMASCLAVDLVNNLDYVITAIDHAYTLIGLAEALQDSQLVNSLSEGLSGLLNLLQLLRQELDECEEQNRPRRPGRPECNIPRQSLEELLELRFTGKEIAKLYNVCRMTVLRKMKKYNLSVRQTYADITNDQLEEKICSILLEHPYTGYKRMLGFLASRGIRVTEQRVRHSMRVVDPLGVAERTAANRAIYRRVYFVRYAMERWHLDTNMKLTRRYKFIIRGCIDGNSRCCVYLHVGNENSARSNLTSFIAAVREWGLPTSIRCDKGGENQLIARFMLTLKGLGSGAVLAGRSVHNQRIERFWVDVYRDTKYYYETFRAMEEKGVLDIDDPNHLFVLHQVYTPRIQNTFNEFVRGWNHHKVSTERNKTPLQLMILNRNPDQQQEAVDSSGIDAAYMTAIAYDGNYEEFNPVRNPRPPVHTLTDEQIRILNEMDFLAPSNNNGENIFVSALQRLGIA